MPAEGDFKQQATHCRVAFDFYEDDMRAIIFANGDASDPEIVRHWTAQADLIIAADGGTRHALSVGVLPHVVIGDLDSLSETDRGQLDRLGVQLIVYPMRKDYTDLELALRFALERGATEIIIFSALGGRWDQSLANLLLLTLPELAQVSTRIIDHHLTIQVIRDRAEITGRAGDTLSLIALKGDALGVTIEGCEYPLVDATLPFGATLGISNVLTQATAKITVKQGEILALHAHSGRREE
jgi:thiamine pyrophosphokinase